MRDDTLGIALLSSVAIHIFVILVGSAIIHGSQLQREEFLPIALVDSPQPQIQPALESETLPEIKRPSPLPPPKAKKLDESKPVVKNEVKPTAKLEVAKPEPPPLPVPAKEEPAQVTETKPSLPAQDVVPRSSSRSRVEGGGSEVGAGNLFDEGDAGAIPGSGTPGGGGGTATSGLGRGSGTPGLHAQTAPVKTNRQAKPIETVRASYPPMALRAGLESDVILKIEVDPQGKVTNAEITKSGGPGFDEEALKAVKQSRFEPAQRDGTWMAAEFTYVYRFRLRR